MPPLGAPHRNADRPPATIGIVAALWIEGLAMRHLIDDVDVHPQIPQDPNHYYLGTLPSTESGELHHVVVTTLPRDNTRNAAAICTDMIRSFPSVRCVIMTGIAGGIPSPDRPARHVRLGDVVVATKGVVDYGHVRQVDGVAYPRRQVDGMSQELARAANELAAKDFEGLRPWDGWLDIRRDGALKGFARPRENTDILYVRGARVEHPPRRESGHIRGKPKIHYAAIGSSDILLRDEVRRDEIASEHGVLAVEMEGSGIAAGSATHGRQWFMVRGISDYCENSGKGDVWQAYASLAAAAYVRAVLAACHPFARLTDDLPVPGAVVRDPIVQPAGDRSEPVAGAGEAAWISKLVGELLDGPFWRQLANRRSLVTILRTRLADLPDFPDGDAAEHLTKVVAICARRSGGLDALREALAAPPQAQAGSAVEMVEMVRIEDLVGEGELDRLRRLLTGGGAQVDPERFRTLAGLTDSEPTDVDAMVERLAGLPATLENVSTLQNAVTRAVTAEGPLADALIRWVDRADALVGAFRSSPGRTPGAPDSELTTQMVPKHALADITTTVTSSLEEATSSPILTAAGVIEPRVPAEDQPLGPSAPANAPAPQGVAVAEAPASYSRRREGPPDLWGPAIPPRNLHFTGREALLDQLDQQLRRGDVAAVLPQALHGLGGVGKTQLAVEYVYRHQGDYDVIWWVPAEQPQQILSALTELAQYLGLKVGPEANTAVPAVKEALRKGEPFGNWLLVFDNAEDAEAVQASIPTGGTGKVLVTSRNAEWMLKAHALEVDVFTRGESIQLLRRRDKQITHENADRLAEALGDLPLAIEQAAAWRATTGMPVDEYLDLLDQKRDELLGITAGSGYESSVAAVWTVSLDRLKEINEGAIHLLEVAANFAPDPIGRYLLTSSRATITDQLDETLRDPIRLGRAIRDIQKFALARIDHRTDSIQVHRLVQAVLVARMPESARDHFRHGAHLLLAAGNPPNPTDPVNWPRYQALLPHVMVSDAVRCPDPWVRSLVFDLVQYLYHWGDHPGCQALAEEVYEAWSQLLGPDHPETLKIAKYFGYILWLNGEYRRAKDIHEDALRRYEAAVDPQDEVLLDARIMIAMDLRTEGRFREALELNQQIYETSLAAFGDDDPFTLFAAQTLGIGLRFAGRFEEALALDTETLRLQKVVLGENHPETLNTNHAVAVDRREAGDYRGARDEQEALYARYLQLLGGDNPATVRAARTLAVARRRAGDHESALELSVKTEQKLRRRYGAGSEHAMSASLNLATDLRQTRDLHGSVELGARVLEDYRRAMGDNHPFTFAARTNLSVTLRLLDKLDEAHRQSAAAFTGLAEVLGRDHAMTLVSAINHASDKYALGDYQGAFELDTDTLERSRLAQGIDHPTTLAANANLALDLRAMGRISEADQIHHDVLNRYRQTLGERHPATIATSHHERADCDIDPLPI